MIAGTGAARRPQRRIRVARYGVFATTVTRSVRRIHQGRARDICARIEVFNRGPEARRPLLPQLGFAYWAWWRSRGRPISAQAGGQEFVTSRTSDEGLAVCTVDPSSIARDALIYDDAGANHSPDNETNGPRCLGRRRQSRNLMSRRLSPHLINARRPHPRAREKACLITR